jgi:hypothetical protein
VPVPPAAPLVAPSRLPPPLKLLAAAVSEPGRLPVLPAVSDRGSRSSAPRSVPSAAAARPVVAAALLPPKSHVGSVPLVWGANKGCIQPDGVVLLCVALCLWGRLQNRSYVQAQKQQSLPYHD